MRRSAFVFFILFTATIGLCYSQSAPAAYGRSIRLTAGGMVSGFDPHDTNQSNYYSDGAKLLGIGTFVDVRFSRWIQVEGEGRWLRWNSTGSGETMDNYLIGLRAPIKEFHTTRIYGKALFGLGKMTFPYKYGYGSFSDLAFGGTVEHDLSRKLIVRGDFEYQYWPKWLNNSSLTPYGASVGIGYRIF